MANAPGPVETQANNPGKFAKKVLWIALEELGPIRRGKDDNYTSIIGPFINESSDEKNRELAARQLTSHHGINQAEAESALANIMSGASEAVQLAQSPGTLVFMLHVYAEEQSDELGYVHIRNVLEINFKGNYGVYAVQIWNPDYVLSNFNTRMNLFIESTVVDALGHYWGNGRDRPNDAEGAALALSQLRLPCGSSPRITSFCTLAEAKEAAEKMLEKYNGPRWGWEYDATHKACILAVGDESDGPKIRMVATIQYHQVEKLLRKRAGIPEHT